MNIEIRTQEEFTALPTTLLESIKKKEDTLYDIALYDNQYYFAENHFAFTQLKGYLDSEKVTLKIHAADQQYKVKIAGCLSNGEIIEPNYHNFAYITTKKKKYSCWQKLWKSKKAVSAPDYPSLWGDKFYNALTTITVKTKHNKAGVCELTYDGSLKKLFGGTQWNKDCCYIQITQWFKSGIYKVTNVDFKNNTIEFYCDDLTYNSQKGTFSINNDFNYSKKYFPKFRLTNFNSSSLINYDESNDIVFPKNVESVDLCRNTNFLNIKDCNCFERINISGLIFNGNAYNSQSNTPALIYINNCDIDIGISISDCEFINLYSDVIRTNNVKGESVYTFNKFEKCWRYGIYATTRNLDEEATSTLINSNSFKDCGLAYNNTFCIRCDCENYKIAENTLNNYGYGGIAVGTWWNVQPQPTLLHSGSVTKNVLKNDKSYSFPLMDSGAIYIYTQNKFADVLNNQIINYYGRYDNRGIFCDDGAFNVTLYENEIKNTQSYSIDSRRVASTESNVVGGHTNVGNVIIKNTFDGNIRFEGNPNFVDDTELGCVLKGNKRTKKVNTQLDIIKDVKGNL